MDKQIGFQLVSFRLRSSQDARDSWCKLCIHPTTVILGPKFRENSTSASIFRPIHILLTKERNVCIFSKFQLYTSEYQTNSLTFHEITFTSLRKCSNWAEAVYFSAYFPCFLSFLSILQGYICVRLWGVLTISLLISR